MQERKLCARCRLAAYDDIYMNLVSHEGEVQTMSASLNAYFPSIG